jgi:hypothetical protein
MDACRGKQPLVRIAGQLTGAPARGLAAPGHDHPADSRGPCTVKHAVAVSIETVMGEIYADINEFSGHDALLASRLVAAT